MNGIIIINKPLGYTSREVVDYICKRFHTNKVGHTGTLDPNADGVLILCIGKALKVCELFADYDKEYIAEVILGIETDTLDMDKNATIIKDVSVNLDDDNIMDIVKSFKGSYMQEVPKYSAVKVNGKKLYEYARSGMEVELPKKEVTISNINITNNIVHRDGKIYFKIKCTVGKGTYIRSLIRDIGSKLGVPAVMNTLTRTRIGDFNIENSYSLEDIENGNYKILDITEAFPKIERISVDDEMAIKIRNGAILDKFFDGEMAFILDEADILLALYKNVDNKSRAYKVFI